MKYLFVKVVLFLALISCAQEDNSTTLVGSNSEEAGVLNLKWITQLGHSTSKDRSMDDVCTGISVDSDGNIYCAGYTESDLGENNGGDVDAFVMKLSSSGEVLWITQLGDTTKGFENGDNSKSDRCLSIAIDSSNNIYCAGDTYGSLGEVNGGDADAFVLKLSSSGEVLWVTQLGDTTKGYENGDNSKADHCKSVSIDSADNIYCAGFTKSSLGEDNGGDYDAFVMKLNSRGEVLWATQLGDTTKGFNGADANNSKNDRCLSVTVDSQNSVYCAGATAGNLGEVNADSNNIRYDAFIMKLSQEGELQWITQLGRNTKVLDGDNSKWDFCGSVAVDSLNNVYCSGQTNGDFGEANSGYYDVFVLKLSSSSGALQWITQLGDTTKGFAKASNSKPDRSFGVAIDAHNNIYCAGYTESDLGEANGGGKDSFVMKLNADGDVKQIIQLGNSVVYKEPGGDNSKDDICFGVTFDAHNNIYCAGYTEGDLGEANGGGKDSFVMKLSYDF